MLELRNITFTVNNDGLEKEILHNLNLVVEDHKLLVITGPNGSGKSTLAKLIAGIEKPTHGSILLDGKDITDVGITDRARMGIAYAFQQPVRFKGLSVQDLLDTAAGRSLTEEETCELLGRVGLCANEYKDRELSASLSGGEIKRIEIASVLARQAQLSIFDEPEAGIDLWSFTKLVETFNELRQKQKGTLLVISHQERILEIADEIVVVANGYVRAAGDRKVILPALLADERAARCPWGKEGERV